MGDHDNSYAQGGFVQIGTLLKNARQDLGLTHEDVERVTKIRARYLEAMERDDYDALPGAVYAQGFLKTYANYLNLDGEALSQELKHRRTGPPPPPNNSFDERSPRENRRNGRPLAGSGRFRGARRRRLSPITIVGGVLGLLVLAIVVTGLYFVGLQASRAPDDSATGSQRSEGVAPQEKGASQNPDEGASEDEAGGDARLEGENEQSARAEGADDPAPVPSEPPLAEPPLPEGLTMEVRVEGNISWLNIRTDGNLVFEQVAQSGFSQTFEAEESITVWSGNAGAVFISVNGQDYGQLGESGEIKVQEFTVKTAEN